ncbi:PadR family transcriptional regulator [archaeon]|nr:PadR family transcriptional regulator [archaeon]
MFYKKSASIHEPSIKGMLVFWIIYLLKKKPMSGYEILQSIKEFTGDTWNPTTGSIYPALHRLKKDGLIEAKKAGKRGKIVYLLTDSGKKNYDQMRSGAKSMMTNMKFRRVFESLVWPNEAEDVRGSVESIYMALIKVRNRAKPSDYKKIIAKLNVIAKEIENI